MEKNTFVTYVTTHTDEDVLIFGRDGRLNDRTNRKWEYVVHTVVRRAKRRTTAASCRRDGMKDDDESYGGGGAV